MGIKEDIHDAFIFGEERDTVQSYYDMLTSDEADRHSRAIKTLFDNYLRVNNTQTLEEAIAAYREAVR